MKHLIAILFLFFTLNVNVIFDFTSSSDIQNWRVVDDVVMGGRSSGEFTLSPDGHGLFSGDVSMENSGGFSSVCYPTSDLPASANSTMRISLKGDGKTYQFRIKHNRRFEYSYVHEFETTGEWQGIHIPLGEMYPVYRGHRLNRSDFNHNSIEELAFFIGNGRPQSFRLLIDKVEIISD